MSVDYSDGGVHALTMGSPELHTILSSAARLAQLVLVDYSASWCGPCRMITPVLHQLAAEHRGRLVVVKVDCEQTPANRQLAADSHIGAFPTFHLYRSQQKVGELRGADQAGLRRMIQQQLPLLGAASGGAGGGSGGKGPLVAALTAALGRVKQGCSYAEFVTAAKTLLAFVGNCLAHPSETKYRRIKLSNPAYQSRLGCRAGGKECLAAIGFREMMEAGEPVMVINDIPPELQEIHTLLQQALQHAEAGAAAATAAERRAANAAPTAAASTAAAPPAVAPTATAPTDAERRAALAASMAAAARSPAAATAGSSAPPVDRLAAGGRGQRMLNSITAKRLAAMLARAMHDCGIAGPSVAAPRPQPERQEEQGGQQEQQQEQQKEEQQGEEQEPEEERKQQESKQQNDGGTPPADGDAAEQTTKQG